MKTMHAFRSLMTFKALLYLAAASRDKYIYYTAGSTLLLKCSTKFGTTEWIGPVYPQISGEIPTANMFSHSRMWNVTLYTYSKLIIPTVSHSNRLQVMRRLQYDFDLQIINASILDEGLYICKHDFVQFLDVGYILQMINVSRVKYTYYLEGSTVLLKCPLDMEWFGPAQNNSVHQIPVIDMHANRSMWLVDRYTQGEYVSPTLYHHKRLQVIRKIRKGYCELRITNTSIRDEGLYFCKDSQMHVVSDYIIIQLINEAIVSSMHDRIEVMHEGETKTLCCSVDSNSIVASTRWMKGNNELLVTYNVNNSCYTIQNVNRHDQGNYTCLAANIFGSGSITIVLEVEYKPFVTSMDDLIEEINEGEKKELCCLVDSNPTPLSTRWLNGSQEVMVTQAVKKTCYTIKNVTRNDKGNYTCVSENILGIGAVTFVLKVNYEPEVSITHAFAEDTQEGAPKKLCCNVDSNPPPTTTRWFNESREISVTLNTTKNCFTIKNVSRYDQGNYTCLAENIIGNGSSRTVLRVKFKPLVSIIHDLIKEMNEGETKILCCFVDSNPSPTSTRWLNGSQEILVTRNVTKSCCTIENVSRYDQGNYTCKAENLIGIGSVTIVLEVKYKPLVSSMHDLIEKINEGETKKLCCHAESNPKPTSTRWLNRSKEIWITHHVTETCYTLINVSRYDQGIYTCIADNTIGSGSTTTFLQVRSRLSLIKNSHSSNSQSIVSEVLAVTIAVLVVGMVIYFCHLKQKSKKWRITSITPEIPTENDDESGHYMEIDMIDDNIVMPLHENNNQVISTVEREFVENRHISLTSAGHSSTSSDDDKHSSVYLDDGYEHPYNALLVINPAEDDHVYLSPKSTPSNADATPVENACGGCAYGFTALDFFPDKSETQSFANEENSNLTIQTVERAIVENRNRARKSIRHSSTSSENDRYTSVYSDNGYENPYNTLLVNTQDEDKHVYLTTNMSNDENASSFENTAGECSFEFKEHDSLSDKSQTHCCANDGEENTESVL